MTTSSQISQKGPKTASSKKITGILIKPKTILLVLLLINVMIFIIHLGLQYSNFYNGPNKLLFFVDIFGVNHESSIPTWFSQFTLLVSAIICWFIALSKSKFKERYVPQWNILGAIFLFLSIDEIAMIHEHLIDIVSRNKSSIGLGNFGSWYIYAAILVGIAFILLFKFWWNLPTKTKILMLCSIFLYLFGAVYFDSFGGRFVGQGFLHEGLIVGIEELFEMFGATLFVYTLCDYAKSQRIFVALAFNDVANDSTPEDI